MNGIRGSGLSSSKVRLSIWSVLGVFMLLMPLGGCNTKPVNDDNGEIEEQIETKVQELPRAEVTVFAVEPRDVVFRSKVFASIEPWSEVKVSAERGGRIEDIRFDDGDAVHEGQLLACVDAARAEIIVRDASAAVHLAEATLMKVKSLTRPQEMRMAEANLHSAESQYELAQREFERIKNLFESKNASQSQFDKAKTDLDVALRALESASEAEELARIGSRDEDIAIAKARLEQAKVAAELAQDDLRKAMANSPVTGYVSRRHVEKGEVVAAGAPLATLVELDRVKAIASVAQEDVIFLHKGDPVSLTLDAYQQETFNGSIYVVDWVGDPQSRTFRLEVEIANPELRLRPGMMGRAVFALGHRERSIVLSADLLWERSGELGVFVVEDDTAHFRPLKLGRYIGDEVLITDGLIEGDQVVLTGPEGLLDGQPVNLPLDDDDTEESVDDTPPVLDSQD